MGIIGRYKKLVSKEGYSGLVAYFVRYFQRLFLKDFIFPSVWKKNA